jgi:hypothetical protein
MAMDNGVTPDAPAASGQGRFLSRIGMGIVLIVVGGLFFLDRLGYDWGWGWHPTIARMWPVLLIVMGLLRLFSPGSPAKTTTVSRPDGTETRVERGSRSAGGEWLLVVGVLMLLHENRWLMLEQSWPLFIVAAGLLLLMGRGSMGRSSRRWKDR